MIFSKNIISIKILALAIAAILGNLSISLACCDSEDKHQLPTLELDSSQTELISQINKNPKTALDYYLLLSSKYFNGLENSRDRRLWYLDIKNINDNYISTYYHFDCDAGGFNIEIRIYPSGIGPIIGINTGEMKTIYDDGKPKAGDPSISIESPMFYHYRNNVWVEVESNLLPEVNIQHILNQYYNFFKAHLNYQGQMKHIWLKHEMLAGSTNIELTGRENFMDPTVRYYWGIYQWDGKRFIQVDGSE